MKRLILCALCLCSFIVMIQAQAIRQDDPELKKIDVVEHIGDQIPMDLTFTDEDSNHVSLDKYFADEKKPVILTLVYFNCPMLCNYLLNDLVQELQKMPWKPGDEYKILTISINPTEKPSLARAKKENYLTSLNKPGSEAGWSFLTGKESQIKKIADAVGFKYYYDEKSKTYAHPAVLTILTPGGKISRYLYGLTHKVQDVKLALVEASEGKLGTTTDRLLLYCFHYDPNARGYVLFAGNVMRVGGIIALILVGVFLLILWKKDNKFIFYRLKSTGTK